ncbi:hypothetical protein AB5I41_31000 [Sphingomonas sp. MMS24-JH45]
MWDAGIWAMRYKSYTWQQLVDLLERHGPESEHGLLVDAEIARRMEQIAVSQPKL